MTFNKKHEAIVRLTAPLYLLSLAAFLALPPALFAAPDPCVTDPVSGDRTCEGNQSAGISLSAPPVTLRVDNLVGPIQTTGDAIFFRSGAGSDLVLYSGRAAQRVTISTTGVEGRGIHVRTIGQPAAPQPDALLDVPIPGAPGVSGGVVRVDSFSDITTGGARAHGIFGYSSTTGYPQSMITQLEEFDASVKGITFKIAAAGDPESGVLESMVPGSELEIDARLVTYVELDEGADPDDTDQRKIPVYGDLAGKFTLGEDGSFSFDPGTAFAGLEDGEERSVLVRIEVDGYRASATPRREGEGGFLGAVVKRVGDDLVVTTFASFDTFGEADPDQLAISKVTPDLNVYVGGLLDKALAAGGGGGSVAINHLGGTITTTGAAAHGVYGFSDGRDGGNGRNGGGFWTFGTVKPTAGAPGNDAGNVAIRVDGDIVTRFEPAANRQDQASVGVLAHSEGGTGGLGGGGGFYYGGRRGGSGGDAGEVRVTGSGVIDTWGRYGTGILAISEGGEGGIGGGGGTFERGSLGGFGGRGGLVEVDGTWDITTRGDEAHGIWAKSVGGNAGDGGSGGWLVGAGGQGGQASDGGAVSLASGGEIVTWGQHAYGLFGQSVGGFGGKGGAGRSLFNARGGSGDSAGSGGDVAVTNRATGSVTTHGVGSHGLVAMSVGGGGGAGGSSGGWLGTTIGGTGSAGGHGGYATATNLGSVLTHNDFARGVHAQSVGGGGGDGGTAISGAYSIGGNGGDGGLGGRVDVVHAGSIETRGIWADGILAQSVGGGGGTGGSAIAGGSSAVAIGGKGGGGGDAGDVAVTSTGTVLTHLEHSRGINAQSVGGGGGQGGLASAKAVGLFAAKSVAIGGSGGVAGDAGRVTVSNAGEIETRGDRAEGIFAQSVGGGGGSGGYAAATAASWLVSTAFSLGGSGGAGGDGNEVEVANAGDITTLGLESHGIFAQSVGGGGGSGGLSVSAAGAGIAAGALALGGDGAGGGESNRVAVENTGSLWTGGERAVGLFAQSVGGGGGSGGYSIAGAGAGIAAGALSFGGDGAGGGQGHEVDVLNTGDIRTRGLESHAIFAQSVGGGGGSGGYSIGAAGAGIVAGALAMGGDGGGGGDARRVDVESGGVLWTAGERAVGIFAQSVGGGGGSGGFSIGVAGAGIAAGGVSLGGDGDGGGHGDEVSVRSTSEITTEGLESHAIFAQSVGGGGGSGGFSIAGAGAGIVAGGLSLGGDGAGGGHSARVEVESDGALSTAGHRAVGLFAQSVGGGGGSGGYSIAGAGAGVAAGSVSLGGDGAGGGDGHQVWVRSGSDIATLGLESHAIFAQSVGGGGGSGGFSIAGAGAGVVGGGFSLGGVGAGGGDSERVEVESSGVLTTAGDRAVGLLAQSVGGGGGDGGFSAALSGAGVAAGSVSIGGGGGGGGDGHEVWVLSTSDISTAGLESHALFAQSVGGGGGSGGFSLSGSGAGVGAGTFSLGGSGGGGGDSKRVEVESHGQLLTKGDEAVGLFAQSVGGGGGRGGFSVSVAGAGVGAGSLSLGGSGGDGGDGHEVSVLTTSDISTLGREAHALFAQSVGGGGGSGGFSIAGAGAGTGAGTFGLGGSGGGGGDSKRVEVESHGQLVTEGDEAVGLFAQSVGGGGGRGGFSLAGSGAGTGAGTLSLGGSGGDGGTGHEVSVLNTGDIFTLGRESHALFAQSVGGGGGAGGFSIAGAGAGTGAGTFGLGGSGGGGGDSKRVDVESHGVLVTEGDEAVGLFAQSVGGGGGRGGFSLAGSGAGTGAGTLSLGGSGGDGGTGHEVSVLNTGDIFTLGRESHALFAQSVGGGGGAGGFNIAGAGAGTGAGTFGLGGSGGGGGDSKRVEVESHGQLVTEGDEAVGLFAQSVGGGGGRGGFSITGAGAGTGAGALSLGGSGGDGGTGHEVSVLNTGDIFTLGRESHALFAQSVGGGGGAGGFSIAGAGAGTGAGTFGLGGSGGGGGDSKRVDVESHGQLVTEGDEAVGLFAQSVGGGGGRGGFSIASAGAGTGAGALSLGGSGGDGGDGHKVSVLSTSDIFTLGRESHALFAQSVGGGGGSGGFSITGVFAGKGGGTFGLGGSGGGGGDSKRVEVESHGQLMTEGDEAVGLFAQSVGGGGGRGGFSIAGLFAGTGGGAASLGGSGGDGGDGHEVAVLNTGAIATLGKEAHGLFAQSVGGGGGAGGFSISAAFAKKAAGSLSLGGSGGGGGDGDAVTVTNEGTIQTAGQDATAVYAQSVGGGGGRGGFSIAGTLGAGEKAVAASVSVGGTGGDGGDAGVVEVTNAATLWTSGDGAAGIVGQSVGGGGGDGGFSIAGTFLGKCNANVSVGGSGGDGGAGAAVSVDNTGDIFTEGRAAHGIRAESTSDGGGSGGFSLAGSLGGNEAKNISVSVGGSGGLGGAAGLVEVDSEATIVTAGDGSHGIAASSIGGGGGSGGSSISAGFGVSGEKGWNVNASVSVGGSGGDGGLGGDVRIGSAVRPVAGVIVTQGDDAHGINAMSVGGGGGTGGSSTAINIDVDRPESDGPANGDNGGGNSLNASVAVGGRGGSGNRSGNVEVDNAADIGTYGAQSHGIHAQSVGGGGGSGGRAAAMSLSTGDLMPWAKMQGDNWGLDVSVGGSGGGGNDGGAVTVTNRGNIYTEGALSRGIQAQSVGGGGGSGMQGVLGTGIRWLDDALEALSPVQTAFAIRDIIEDPKAALPKSGTLAVGGGDGVSGDGQAVRVDNLGDIRTLGMSSHAIFAQSVGGGGGEAQMYARARGEADESGRASEAWAGIGVIGDLLLGGANGAAGDGGRVDVLHTGNIRTDGQAAMGIYAQSVGGGGGQAGSFSAGLADPLQLGLDIEHRREGGGDGDGGLVNVATSGAIITAGEASVGIFAQSVGGGGGVIGNVGDVAFAGSVGGRGAGGDVAVAHSGAIFTSGSAAHGIFAQSAGGTVESGAAAGRVDVTIDGDIEATGEHASGIVAQSMGESGNGSIGVRIESGRVIGGSGEGAGVRLLDGLDNQLANFGVVAALSDMAVIAGAGNDRIDNRGVLYGSVSLGAGDNALVNHRGAALHSGAHIDLGAGNALTNAGRVSPGGDGVLATTFITGHLVQAPTGVLSIDLDTAKGAADHLAVSGGVRLDGLVGVRLMDIGYVMPGSHSVSLLSAGEGISDLGLALDVMRSPVSRFGLVFDDERGLLLDYAIDFAPQGALGPNQLALGHYVNALQTAGGSAAFAPMAVMIMELEDVESLASTYDQLSPVTFLGTAGASLAANQQFSGAMLSCYQVGGAYRFTAETDCSWARLAGSDLTQDPVRDIPGFNEEIISISGGTQKELDGDLHVGGALSFETGRVRSEDLARSDVERLQAGAMIKQRRDALTLAAGLTGGFGRYDTTRFVDLPRPDVRATSKQHMQFIALRSRLAYTLERENWYGRPMLDANYTYASFDGFTERGAGMANLTVKSRSEGYFSVNPAIEFGREVAADDEGYTRLYARVGALHYVSGRPEITATLEGAPEGVAPFQIRGELDETYLDLALGVDLVRGKTFGMRVEYTAQLSDNTERQGVQLKLARRFK